MSFIQFRDFSFSFNDSLIIDNISFNINSGDHLTIFGPSGSGKTTILKSIIGEYKTTSNNILIGNKSSNDYEMPIGYVPQSNELLPWLSVEENITLWHSESKFKSGLNNSYDVDEAIELVHLTNHRKKYPKELSGGMAKRAAIARMLVTQCEIVLLDEAFVSVERQLTKELMYELKSYFYRTNKTVIIISHDLEEVTFFSDRLLAISPSPASILYEKQNPISKRQFNISFQSDDFKNALKYFVTV